MDIATGDDSPNMFKKIQLWSVEDTRLLLDLYSKYLLDIGPLKRFRNKKEMWAHMATEISGKSAKQCEERYKTVLKRKKPTPESYKASALKRHRRHFEDRHNKKYLNDDSFNSESQIGRQLQIKKEIVVEEEEVVKVNDTKKNKTVQEILLEIAEKKEKGKERRHMEKLNALHRIEIMLQKILDNKYK